jgi:putative ABC transport system permease protein
VLFEAVRQALRILWAHKMRSFLTMFGIVWGTAAVIFLVSWGAGVQRMFDKAFFKAGKNMGEVWAGRVSEDFTPAVDRRYLWYTMEDIEVLRRRARLPEIVGAEAWRILPVAYKQRAINVDVRGIEPEVMQIRGVPLAQGRGISRSDVDHRRRVAVVGDAVRRRLLGPEGGLGSWVRIDGVPFKVVGLLEHVGVQFNRDRMLIDDHAWVPISAIHANWPEWWTDEYVVSKVLYRMRGPELLEETEREVRSILAERLGVGAEDQEAVAIHSAIKMLRRLPLSETRGLMFILAVTTMVIGGIGILNMMLDSVYERRREIGIRLAVGARRRDVVAQFFLETFTVTSLGGALGVALGVGGCLALAGLDAPDLVPLPILNPGIVVTALAVMSGVGIAAGVIPAWRAARIDPALTLRME